MYSIAKNIWKYLVKSETLLYFVVPNSRSHTTSKYIRSSNRLSVSSLSASTLCGCDCLATKGGTLSLYIYITKLLTTKCQTVSKALIQGIIVPVTHPTQSNLPKTYVTNVLQDRHSSEPNSRMKSRLTKSESPEYGMMPKNSISRICTTSIIPSWLLAGPLWSFTSAIPRVR